MAGDAQGRAVGSATILLKYNDKCVCYPSHAQGHVWHGRENDTMKYIVANRVHVYIYISHMHTCIYELHVDLSHVYCIHKLYIDLEQRRTHRDIT